MITIPPRVKAPCGAAWLTGGILYLVALTHASLAAQQPAPVNPATYKSLPEGSGKAPLIRMCSMCHELERVLAVRQTPQGWATILENMSQRGASGTDEEWAALFDYLSTHFAPRPRAAATPPGTVADTANKPGAPAQSVRSVFATSVQGGSIEQRATDPADTATAQQIRTQLREAVQRFTRGDYTAPPFVDAQKKPGLESLKPFAARIKFEVEELPDGGKLVIDAAGAEAVEAVQTFLRAQQRSTP
jgi:hypothetical protein